MIEDLASAPTRLDAAVPIIEAHHLTKEFGQKPDLTTRVFQKAGFVRPSTIVRAVNDVDLRIGRSEVVGLVGESGCGKSTLGRIVAGLLAPTGGTLLWSGKDSSRLKGRERTRSKLNVQMVFQNPMASLNPRMTIGSIIREAPAFHGMVRRNDDAFLEAQMLRVGLDPRFKTRLPHELSGGQRQRVGISRALAVNPEVLVCDEAVAALDVSIQAQIINLLADLKRDLGLTILFISHDLGVIKHLSDRVVIMYLGRVIEEAPTDELFNRANHPYTVGLLEEIPEINTERRTFAALKGELPSPLNPPSGCHFHPRCPFVMERCRVEVPALRPIASGHSSACHLNDRR